MAYAITRAIDFLYFGPFRRLLPLQMFRYAACGGMVIAINWVLYPLFYGILHREVYDLGFVAVSRHVATLLLIFPVTLFCGFWLQRHISFRHSPLRRCTQFMRYALSVAGSLVGNWLILNILVVEADIHPIPANMITTLVMIVYSYLMQKYFTFRGCVTD